MSLPDYCWEPETQAAMFRETERTAIVVNSGTTECSDLGNRTNEGVSRVSPEPLISEHLEKLINVSMFHRRVCLLDADKVFLLESGGEGGFRQPYKRVQYVRA